MKLVVVALLSAIALLGLVATALLVVRKPAPPVIDVKVQAEPVPMPKPAPHKRAKAKKSHKLPAPVFRSTPSPAYSCETVKSLASTYHLDADEMAAGAAKRGVSAADVKRIRACLP